MGIGDDSAPATFSRVWTGNLAYCELASPRAYNLAYCKLAYCKLALPRAYNLAYCELAYCELASLRASSLVSLRARELASSTRHKLASAMQARRELAHGPGYLASPSSHYCELALVRALSIASSPHLEPSGHVASSHWSELASAQVPRPESLGLPGLPVSTYTQCLSAVHGAICSIMSHLCTHTHSYHTHSILYCDLHSLCSHTVCVCVCVCVCVSRPHPTCQGIS